MQAPVTALLSSIMAIISVFFFDDQVDSYLISRSIDELTKKLTKVMSICLHNLLYAKQLQKRANNKSIKL